MEVSKEEEEWSLQEEVDFSRMVLARPHPRGTSDRSRSRTWSEQTHSVAALLPVRLRRRWTVEAAAEEAWTEAQQLLCSADLCFLGPPAAAAGNCLTGLAAGWNFGILAAGWELAVQTLPVLQAADWSDLDFQAQQKLWKAAPQTLIPDVENDQNTKYIHYWRSPWASGCSGSFWYALGSRRRTV